MHVQFHISIVKYIFSLLPPCLRLLLMYGGGWGVENKEWLIMMHKYFQQSHFLSITGPALCIKCPPRSHDRLWQCHFFSYFFICHICNLSFIFCRDSYTAFILFISIMLYFLFHIHNICFLSKAENKNIRCFLNMYISRIFFSDF